MTNLLGWGAEWLAAQRTEHLSRPVTYQRGADTAEVSATIGRTVFELDNGFGLEKVETRDYLVPVEQLVLAGQPTLPARGDRILESDGTQTFVYEVMSPARDKPPWRYSDPFRQAFRIHTKHIDTQ